MSDRPAEQSIMPLEAAGLLVMFLEHHGALFTLQPDGFFLLDLNPCDVVTDDAKADKWSRAVLSLRDEIRAVLQARRITH